MQREKEKPGVMSRVVLPFILQHVWNIEAPGKRRHREEEKEERGPRKILWKFLPLAELALLK